MKPIFAFLVLTLIATLLYAQNDSSFAAYSTHLNPFKKVGIDEKVLVIRGFDFMDENPRYVTYFGWVYDRETKKIIAKAEEPEDTAQQVFDKEKNYRWLSMDPVLKAYESPYVGIGNNPILFIDPDGRDTIYVHAQRIEDQNEGETVVFKITFSYVLNGVESPISIPLPEGRQNVYFMVPKKYYKGGNVWYKNGESEEFEIRFEEYNDYSNSIRLKYVNKEGVRVLAHKLSSTIGSVGCNAPSTDCTDQLDYGDDKYAWTENSQEVLDGIRLVFDNLLNSEETKDKYGRKVAEPTEGHDFLMKTNSTAKNENPISISTIRTDKLENQN